MGFRLARTIKEFYKHPSTYVIATAAFFPEIAEGLLHIPAVASDEGLQSFIMLLAIISSYLRRKDTPKDE